MTVVSRCPAQCHSCGHESSRLLRSSLSISMLLLFFFCSTSEHNEDVDSPTSDRPHSVESTVENKSIAAFPADCVHPLCVLPSRFGILTGTSKPPLRLEVASYIRFLIRFCGSNSRLLIQSERSVHVRECMQASGWHVMLLYFLPTLVMWLASTRL